MDTTNVTRFEVITPEGIAMGVYAAVKVELQDDGRTLKVFLDDLADAASAEAAHHAELREALSQGRAPGYATSEAFIATTFD